MRGGKPRPQRRAEPIPQTSACLPEPSHGDAKATVQPYRRALGTRAEDAVAIYLAECGLQIVARNVRVGRLEIDLVARDGPVIVVVEVRTRGAGSFQRGLDSIDARKRARIRKAGEELWRARFARDHEIERMRFDAASVSFLPDGTATVEHIRAAF